jgi:hypothetical protein
MYLSTKFQPQDNSGGGDDDCKIYIIVNNKKKLFRKGFDPVTICAQVQHANL